MEPSVPAGQPRKEVFGEGAEHGTRGACGPQTEDMPASPLVSVQLSLDHVDAAACPVVPRPGVCQGGDLEDLQPPGLARLSGFG